MSRSSATQLAVAVVLVGVLGGALQLHKLASIDASGREFAKTSNAQKVMFLLPFAFAKAMANLVAGAVADDRGRRPVVAFGWCVGALAPALGALAAALENGGFVALTISFAFLGASQGLTWTALVLAAIDICGGAKRGFASGLNETVGYTSIAAFAHVYGAMERRFVRCAWTTKTRSAACERANVAQTCETPDDWRSACVGACACRGYAGAPMYVELGMCAFGLALTVFALKESLGRRRFAVGGWVNDTDDDDENGDKITAQGGMQKRGGERDERGGSVAFASARTETLREAMYRTTWGNKSTAVVCFAAFCSNFETAVAWGLMSVWARDQLSLTGHQRDVFTACYSFMKGFTQLGSGMLSDKVGRKAPMAFGLIGGSFALLIAVFGAGFRGYFTVGSTNPERLKSAEYAALTISSMLLGFCTGVTYPVLAAAAVDHAPDQAHYAYTVGVVRFWRDLGYAMGVPLAAIADSSSTEVALILVAVFMLAAGVAVAKIYVEQIPTSANAGYVETLSEEPDELDQSDVELSRYT